MTVHVGEALTPREIELVGLTDEQVVVRLYALINELELEDEQQRDALFWLIGEATERWCPGAAMAERVESLRSQFSDAEFASELEATCERWSERWRARIMRQCPPRLNAR